MQILYKRGKPTDKEMYSIKDKDKLLRCFFSKSKFFARVFKKSTVSNLENSLQD